MQQQYAGLCDSSSALTVVDARDNLEEEEEENAIIGDETLAFVATASVAVKYSISDTLEVICRI